MVISVWNSLNALNSQRISTEGAWSWLPSAENYIFSRKPAKDGRCSPRNSIRSLVIMEKLIPGSLNLRCFFSSVPVDFFIFFIVLCGKLPVLFSCSKTTSGNGQQKMGPSHHGQIMWCRALSVLMRGARYLEQCQLWHLPLRLVVCDEPNTDRRGQGTRKDCWGSWVVHHNPWGKARKTRLGSLFRMLFKHKPHSGSELTSCVLGDLFWTPGEEKLKEF